MAVGGGNRDKWWKVHLQIQQRPKNVALIPHQLHLRTSFVWQDEAESSGAPEGLLVSTAMRDNPPNMGKCVTLSPVMKFKGMR